MKKKSLIITLVISTFLMLAWCNSNEKVDEKIENSFNQQEGNARDFWLDFSDYTYAWIDDEWNMYIYSTWTYNEQWLPEWKWVAYYSNGQIKSEWYFENWVIQGTQTLYYPTYWNYLYFMTWDKIMAWYGGDPTEIEEKPTWRLESTINYKDWVLDGLTIQYRSTQNIETKESVIDYKVYHEKWNQVRIEIKWNRYPMDDRKKMSKEEQDAIFEDEDDEYMYWYYELFSEKLPWEYKEELFEENEMEQYIALDSLDEWVDNGNAKGYKSQPIWSWDELIEPWHMILRYPNWNIKVKYNLLWTDKNNKAIMHGNQIFYDENWQVEEIQKYYNNEKNGLFLFANNNEIKKFQYYDYWELKFDSELPDDSQQLDAFTYYNIISDSSDYCMDGIASLPKSEEEKRFVKEGRSALDVCEKSIKAVEMVWDYKWNSSLKNATINYLSWIIYEWKMFVDLKENQLNNTETEKNTEITLNEKIPEAKYNLDRLYNEFTDACALFTKKHLLPRIYGL